MLLEEKNKISKQELLAWVEGLTDSKPVLTIDDWKIFASLIKKTDDIDQFKAWLSGFIRGLNGKLPTEEQMEEVTIRLRLDVTRDDFAKRIKELEKNIPPLPYDPRGPDPRWPPYLPQPPAIPGPFFDRKNLPWWDPNPVYGPIKKYHYHTSDGTGNYTPPSFHEPFITTYNINESTHLYSPTNDNHTLGSMESNVNYVVDFNVNSIAVDVNERFDVDLLTELEETLQKWFLTLTQENNGN